MLTDYFCRYLFNLDTFHRFSFFLGTEGGELLKRSIELIFYLIIIYMIFSEFNKNKKREYKYLIIGFFALLSRQIIMSLILFTRVFSPYSFNRFLIFTVFLDKTLEIIALLLLVVAFIFPAYKHITKKFQKYVVFFFCIISSIISLTYIFFKNNLLTAGYELVILDLIEIFILISPFYFLITGKYKKIKYLKSILFAFFVYLLIPLIRIISIALTGYIDPRITVIQHPLPFISIILLIRTVYLTLVDKAFLKSKLEESEKTLKHEKELSRLKDHFISIVSHELRTPITSMKLYLALLDQGKFGEISKKQKKAIKTLVNENNRLSHLIMDLLTINKIEANKLVLEKEKFRIKELIDGLYINIAKGKGIKIIDKIKNFEVFADKNRLKQVYINLINNAIKFSKKGDSITISSKKNKKEWTFSVKDTGIGIPPEEVPRLFNKFYQVDNALTRNNQGIGLGLSIVKNIVELHKGKIEINSGIGKGSEFKIRIPIKK